MLSKEIRPHVLDDVVGQSQIVKALKNYFKNKTLPSVLYFIGQSGAGKNTFANIVASTLVCDSSKEDPCLQCSSCLDIINGNFQKNVQVFNGSDLTADAIRELEKSLSYSSFDMKPKVIIINEAQTCVNLKRLLEIIEQDRKDTYFIFTSTDKNKFSTLAGNDNKSQETQALRSRGAFFNIKSISTNDIKEYLFSLLEKYDPDEKVPDTFLDEGLQLISENANGNIRLAVNDFNTALSAEAYTQEDVRSLLGYEDEKEFITLLYGLCMKETDAIAKIAKKDLQSFFMYSWKILTDISIRHITNTTFSEQWKEKSAKAILATNNFDKVLKIYEDTNKICLSYFNPNVFMNNIYMYYKNNPNGVSKVDDKPIIKKKIIRS